MSAAAQTMPDPESETDEFTFLIPEPNVERFRKKLNALTKRAAKLGLAPLAAVDLGEVVKTRKHRGTGGKEIVVEYRYRKLLVTGERPKLNGWTLLGTVAHEDGGNVFSNAPGQKIPERYRDVTNLCDHCKTRRRRRDTMIIEKDGGVRQIGRNCLQDFIGDVNVKGVTFYYELWPSMDKFVGGMGDGVSKDYTPTEDYLSAVACAIRHDGFVSGTAARENDRLTATSSVAWQILYPNPRLKSHERPPAIEAQDREAAMDLLDWIVNDLGQRDGLTGYMANLKAACAGGWMRHKHSGLAASAFRGRENDILGEKKAADRRKSHEDRQKQWDEERAKEKNEFFGEIKERSVWTLRVLKIEERDSDWGSYTKILLKDPEGRMAGWDTTSASEIEKLEKGKTYLIQATVKKHVTWSKGDVNCTYLTRGKVKGVVVEED